MKWQTPLAVGGITMPVTTIVGQKPGPAVLITAGIHGAEYVGIETARRLTALLDPNEIAGRVTIVPCVNQAAFKARVPALNPLDQKNINRMFPGNQKGTSSEQIAAALTGLQDDHDFYLDLHGGDLHENLAAYVYFQGDCDSHVSEQGQELCRWVDVPVRIRSTARTGAYNSANHRGTPSILIERGCAGRWSETEVAAYLRDVTSVLGALGVIENDGTLNQRRSDDEQLEMEAYYEGAPDDGLWYPAVQAGDKVSAGQALGELRDFNGALIHEAIAKKEGVVHYLSGTLFVPKGVDLVAY